MLVNITKNLPINNLVSSKKTNKKQTHI